MMPLKLLNPFSVSQTIDLLRYILDATRRHSGLALLEQSIERSKSDPNYQLAMETTLLTGSTLEFRTLFSVFGEYFGPPQSTYPFYPHTDSVNQIDSAMHVLKLGCIEESIIDYNTPYQP